MFKRSGYEATHIHLLFYAHKKINPAYTINTAR